MRSLRCIAEATIRARSTTPTSVPSNTPGGPTVILAKTVKGFGLAANEARNASHQEKKLSDEGLVAFIKRFDIPVPEECQRRRERHTVPRRTVLRSCTCRSIVAISAVTCLPATCQSWTSRPFPLDYFKEWTAWLQGPRSFHHTGVCQRPWKLSADGSDNRETDRSDCAG